MGPQNKKGANGVVVGGLTSDDVNKKTAIKFQKGAKALEADGAGGSDTESDEVSLDDLGTNTMMSMIEENLDKKDEDKAREIIQYVKKLLES